MPNFYIPLSGLNSDSTALNTIANNLSNMNTTGFKSQTTNFSDLFYQEVGTTGSGDQIQVGTGVQVASNSTDFSAGSISSTGISTDAAINGTGFFVLDSNGSQLLTRDGSFQTSPTGTLESTDGLAVMGYGAVNGVVKTTGALTDIAVPTGQVMQPSATTSFSMTQNLDSSSPVGSTTTGNVNVYDSLGTKYDATVTYTNLGNNTWSYQIAIPDTLAAATAAAAAATLPVGATLPAATAVPAATTSSIAANTTPILLSPAAPLGSTSSTTLAQNPPVVAAPNTTLSYTLAPTGVVNGASTLTVSIGGKSVIVQPTTSDETVQQYAADITTQLADAGIVGVAVTGVNGVPATGTPGSLSFKGTTVSAFTVTGSMQQDVPLTTTSYTLGSYTDPTTGSNKLATVDPTTTLAISEGTLGPISAPGVTTPQSVTAYAAALQTALTSAGINDVKVTGNANSGKLSISGPANMSISGYVNQDILGTIVSNSVTPTAATATTPVSATLASVTGASSINGSTLSSGNPATLAASSALPATVPAAAAVTNQAVAASTTGPGNFTYNFATSNGNVATVNSGTNLEFVWPNGGGPAITSVAPVVAPGETLANYAVALNASLGPLGGTAVLTNSGELTVTVPATTTVVPTNSTITQDFSANQSSYNFVTSNGAVAAVDKSTNLTFTWTDSSGNVVNTVAPGFGANNSESIATYAAALNTAMATAGISGATATVSGTGQITISGPSNMSVAAGGITQDFTGTSIPYNFALTGTAATNSNLRITGPTGTGGTATTALPVFTGTPETANAYATDLNTAIAAAGIVGVNVTGVNATGLLTITGPTSISTTGNIQQDVAMTATNYNLTSSNGAVASVAPSTTLNISEAGGPAVAAPAFSTAQSVSAYATSLQTALTAAGITDVTVTGSNVTGLLSINAPSNVTIAGRLDQDFNATTTNFDFGSYTDPNTGLTAAGLVGSTTSLQIGGINAAGATVTTATITPSNPGGETVSTYAAQVTAALQTAGITGVTVSANAGTGQLSITGPSSLTFAGNVSQNLLGSTTDYAFQSNATVDPTTDLVIAGETATGATARIAAPQIVAGETVSQYATALTAALSTAGITNVTVTSTNGQLAITGANVSTSGNLVQGLADTAINYNFGSTATVNPATNITIEGPTVSGNPVTAITTAPAVVAGETVAEYAIALTNAMTAAGINTGPQGVSVTAKGGQLSIVGPAATLKTAGTATQDLMAQTISYQFGTSGNSVGTVDPSTNLTITGLTTSGATATTAAPTVTPGMTLNAYATALTNALSTAGIAGVTVSSTAGGLMLVTGANISTAGSLIQNPVASANASGTLAFNTSGNLVNPSGDLSNISFTGLSDNAAPLSMAWDLFGANGTGTVSQTAAPSVQSAQNANGYTSGDYESFTIDSNGTVTATYSNGQNQTVGQLALGTVNNQQGLVDVGSTEYTASNASGQVSVGAAGSGGRGEIQGSSLEAGNVNISAEFSDLIVAQRAFEANSKAVTTFDSITQETINMIH